MVDRMAKVAIVLGAGGFIGHHLVRRLRADGFDVHGVDKGQHEFPVARSSYLYDLTDPQLAAAAVEGADHVYQLATDMGGAGYIFTGDHDAQVMTTGALINLNVLQACVAHKVEKVFFSSSACVYDQQAQEYTDAYPLKESYAYPANPDSEYGWEKLFSERLYLAYARNHPGLQVRIARFHSIVGDECTWQGGREKVFAALCRKIAEAPNGGAIRMWGDGEQTRTFLHIDDCLNGVRGLMDSAHSGPFNLGSTELVSINQLATMIIVVAGKDLQIIHEPGPLGVRGRCSDNSAIEAATGWKPSINLLTTVERVYPWVLAQVEQAHEDGDSA